MIYSESPKRKLITEHVSWGHWFALANIVMAICISSVYLFSTPIDDTPLSFTYVLITWLGHISFMTFLGFIVLILPLCYKITHTRWLKLASSVIAAIGLALLAFDALLYNKTGFHISFSSAELLKSEAQGTMRGFGWLQWFYLILLFVMWLMLQLVIANGIHNRLHRLQNYRFSPVLITGFVVCFIGSHALHIWADARLYTPILKQDNMFPLSYPATAKTLMARYGLLDLETRRTREGLQYNSERERFSYPPRPVYCSVDNSRKAVVLASLEPTERNSFDGLHANNFHLNLVDNQSEFMQQLIFGIPTNLLNLTSSAPLAKELLLAFDVQTHTFIQQDEQAADAFINQIEQASNGLFIGILTAETLASIDMSELVKSDMLYVIQQHEEDYFPKLHSKHQPLISASSNEDLLPSILTGFGCLSDVNRYSTGQALQKPVREWLVSTKNNNLILVKYPLLSTIANDGSYEVTNLVDNTKQLVEVDTNLLSRSIKHLRDFSRN